MNSTKAPVIPKEFVWRRLHSLMGLWLVLFLIEHLLTNSQAALLLGDNGSGFVRMVNAIHNFPYLEAVEIFLLGVPILIHLVFGIKYLFTAKMNSYRTDGRRPSLPQYGRNRAYSWQRITSWILLIGMIGHVVKFRFIEYPLCARQGEETSYFVRLNLDNGLYTVANKLGVTLYDAHAIQREEEKLNERDSKKAIVEAANEIKKHPPGEFSEQKAAILTSAQNSQERALWVDALERRALSQGQVIAIAKDFGTASLLVVRNTFKQPIYLILYTIFVLAATFHAFNGLWTFLITWGLILKASAQKTMTHVTVFLMILLSCLGLAAVWGTYWLNLKQ